MPLEANQIGYRYRNGQWLFRDVDLIIEPGETVGLTGASGSGKTTLGRILSGYTAPIEGGVQLTDPPFLEQRINPVQMIFQHPEHAVNPYWTVRSILHEAWRPAEDDMLNWGIDPAWLHRRPSELSGGQLQRICILRAMGPTTRYIIADEITTMLDAVTQAQIWHTILATCRERNIGLLVISHDRRLVERVCNRVLSMSRFT